MSAGLSIASSGLEAAQTAMNTIAQNLANANTPGYVAERADLVTNPGGDALGVGDGVRAAGVDQVNDLLLSTNALQTQGALSQSTALQQVLSGAQAAFPEPNGSGLADQLSGFWQAWDSIAQAPSSLAPYTQVVDLAQNLVVGLHQATTELTNLQGNAELQLHTVVGQADDWLAQVASLNAKIVTTEGAGASANALIDQQNQVISNLAQSIGAVARPAGDGTTTVSVGGITLVQGTFADTLQVTGSAGSASIVASSSGATLPTTGGSAAGLLAAIDQYLPAYQSQLDGVANSLASTVNTQLAAGYSTTGVPGSDNPLFTGAGAAGLAVNPDVVADPQLIAASSTDVMPDASNNGGNAQAMAELAGAATGPDQAYRSLIQGLGAQVQSVDDQVDTNTAVATAAQQNLQAATGVHSDSQMVTLLQFQQSYQAAAKVIQTIDTAMQSLLAAV